MDIVVNPISWEFGFQPAIFDPPTAPFTSVHFLYGIGAICC